MTTTVREAINVLQNMDAIINERDELLNEVRKKDELLNGYREILREREETILNYKGVLRRYEDEIHVLYHKSSTLLKYKPQKPAGDAYNRDILQKMLDNVKPTDIRFGKDGEIYTLEKWGTLSGMGKDYVSEYKEETLRFC